MDAVVTEKDAPYALRPDRSPTRQVASGFDLASWCDVGQEFPGAGRRPGGRCDTNRLIAPGIILDPHRLAKQARFPVSAARLLRLVGGILGVLQRVHPETIVDAG